MKALSLLCVFVVAKLVILAGGTSELPWSPGTPLALFWQDAAFVLGFAVLERAIHSRLFIGTLYWGIAGYTALNVPVIRMFSSPLTLPMFRATRGTLADSIEHHVDLANLMGAGLVLATALAAPLILRRLAAQPGTRTYAALLAICLLGLWSDADTAGLERNSVAAVIISGREHVKPVAHVEEWRKSVGDSALASWPGLARGRNVVLVLLESTGARHLKFYGAPEDPTPNLTRMAESGIVFDHAYAAYPESIKGLFSILSSRYPAIETASENYRHIGKPALAEALRGAGYRTALFHSGRFMYLGMDDIIQDRGYEQLCDAGAIGGQHESSFGVDEPATVDRMLEWLKGLPSGEPFFLTYLPTAGHHPYLTPEPGPFPEETDAQRYLNALHYGDQAIGQLVEGLKKLGLYDDTLFVFCGDHGEAFKEHAGNVGHTLYIYEENVRVPLVVFAPGLTTTQIRGPHLASVIDLAPTILDFLGLEIPPAYQGVSLLRTAPGTALFYTDYSLPLLGLREERWKFIYEFASGRSSLFDLQEDPAETINLCRKDPERTRRYAERLKAWIGAQKELVLREAAAAKEVASPPDFRLTSGTVMKTLRAAFTGFSVFTLLSLPAVAAPESETVSPHRQLPKSMHGIMTSRAKVSVGVREGDITGADQRALQAAVDYVASLGGGTVEIGPGEYLMRDSLHLRANVTVRGHGVTTVLRKAKAASSPLTIDGDYGEEQITLQKPEGFAVGDGVAIWDKDSGGFHTTVARITGRNGDTFAISLPLNADCMVAGRAQAATVFPVISGYNLDGARVESLTIDGDKESNVHLNGCRGAGIFLYRCPGTVISNCVVRRYNGDGISFQQSNDAQVLDCVSEDNASLGFHPGSGSQRPLVRDCTARRNGEDGLFLCWRVKHGTFENNLLQANGRYGISIGHKDTDNLIRSNRVLGNHEDGIFFRNETDGMAGHRNRVENNLIENNGGKNAVAGIRVRGETKDLVLQGNTIRDTRQGSDRRQTTGIALEENVGAVQTEGNTIDASTAIQDKRKQKH